MYTLAERSYRTSGILVLAAVFIVACDHTPRHNLSKEDYKNSILIKDGDGGDYRDLNKNGKIHYSQPTIHLVAVASAKETQIPTSQNLTPQDLPPLIHHFPNPKISSSQLPRISPRIFWRKSRR